MRYLRILGILISIAAIAAATPTFTADFSGGTEGWTVWTPYLGSPGGTGPVQVASGGVDGGGYLEAEDGANGMMFFVAPTSWAGNFLGGALSFYLRNENPQTYRNIGYLGDPVIRISGAGPDLYYFNAPGANITWTLNEIALLPGANWSLDPYALTVPAPEADVLATLSSVNRVYINADWVYAYFGRPNGDAGHDITGLDAVTFTPPVPEPATYALIGVGLLALALIRHRKRG